MNPMLAGGLPAVLSGICFVSFLYFGFYLLPTAAKDARFKPFVFLCFFSSAWCFCFVMFFLSADARAAEPWQRMTYAGMSVFVLHLLFIIDYVSLIRNRWTVAILRFALLLPPLVAAYESIAYNAVALDFPAGFWFLFAQIQTTVYNAASIVLFLIFYLKRKTNKRRIQAYILCVSGLILVVLSWIADYFLGLRGARNIEPFWLLLWFGVVVFTIRKYRFIPITVEFINKDITENIEEGIVLLDPDRNLIFTNRAMRRIANVGDGDILRLEDIISKDGDLDAGMAGMAASGSRSFRTRANIVQSASGAKVAVDVKVTKIMDSFRDTTGFLIIVSMIKELEGLKITYGITARELDVIRQLSFGRTNRDIAGMFGLAERTVESHITHIYAKLGVSNRVELLNLVAGCEPGGGPAD